MTTEVAAAHLGIHPEVLRRWNRRRDRYPWLPRPRRVGRAFRWDIGAIDAAIAAIDDTTDEPTDEVPSIE